MSDETELDLDAGAVSTGKKGGLVSNLLSGMLKWILIGIAGVILIIVVVFLVVRAISSSNSNASTPTVISEEYRTNREVLDWYQSLATIRTKTKDAIPASVVVDLALGYKQGEKEASVELTSRLVELNDWLRRFFAQKTADELAPEKEAALKQQIKNGINDELLSRSKIRDVAFKQLDVTKQM